MGGFNGWHSNHNVAIHWLLDQKQCGEPFRGIELLRAVRIAGIAAVVSNTVADDRRIPVGGYGQVGICHDSMGIVEQAVRGSTQVFPNVATPEAHLQMLHKTATLATVLAGRGAPQEVLDDVKCLAKAFADVLPPAGVLTNLAVRHRVRVAHSLLPLKCCYSPSGQGYLISGSEDKEVYIYSLAKGLNYKMQYLKHHQVPVVAVAVNLQDTLLASADSLGRIVMWRRMDFSHIAE